VISIVGSTGAGKTALALNLSKYLPINVISADSRQVYKYMDIGTAKPTKEQRNQLTHYLVDYVNPDEKYNLNKFIIDSNHYIDKINRGKNIPIIVGGTGLYFKALTDGLVKIPNIPMKTRNKIRLMQKKLGQTGFYNKLLKLDPLIKNKIEKNDIQRSIRAYEIKHQTKKSIIEWFKKTKIFFSSDEFIKLYIDYPREMLINRISLRVDDMFRDAVIEEVVRFNKLKVKKENSSNKVIGIKEITNLLNKQCTLEQTKELIVIKTRQYAKRQVTWARGQMQSWQKINPKNLSLILKKLK